MQDEIDLRVVFENFWRRKVLLLGSIAVSIGLAFTYLHVKKPLFLASSKFAVKESEDQTAGQLRSLAALAGINVGGGSSVSPDIMFAEMLQDDEFLEKILERKWAMNGDSVTLEALWKLAPDTTKPNWRYRFKKQRIAHLRDGGFLKLEKNKSTGIITLKTLFETGELAFQVNNHLLELFNQFMIENQISQAGEKKKFINARIAEVEKDLYRSEQSLVDFQMKNKSVTVPTVMMEMLRLKRSTEINQELYLQLKKQLELAKIEEKNDQPLIQLISKPAVPITHSKPKRAFVLAGFTVIGAFAGFALIIGHFAYSALFGRAGVRKP